MNQIGEGINGMNWYFSEGGSPITYKVKRHSPLLVAEEVRVKMLARDLTKI